MPVKERKSINSNAAYEVNGFEKETKTWAAAELEGSQTLKIATNSTIKTKNYFKFLLVLLKPKVILNFH